MIDVPILPLGLDKARHTPMFTLESLPGALVASHRTTVWAELHVQTGSVRYIDLEGETRRDIRVDADHRSGTWEDRGCNLDRCPP